MLLRIGNVILNLIAIALVTIKAEDEVVVTFSDAVSNHGAVERPTQVFKGDDAKALIAYLDGEADDVANRPSRQIKDTGLALRPAPVIRAKVRVSAVTETKSDAGDVVQESVVAYPVTGDSEENKQWAKYTPSGSLSLSIDNPSAFGRLPQGAEFFVDLTPAA
jgi:hypothetical protein